jgi:hypothetical protein
MGISGPVAYRQAVRTMIGSVLLAVVVAVAAYPAIVTATHPDRCSYVGSGDVVTMTFCVRFDQQLERYEYPPPGVPADFSRPDPAGLNQDRVLDVLLFSVMAPMAWVCVTTANRLVKRRRRQHKP